MTSSSFFFLLSISALSWFFFNRASRWPMILLTVANLRVLFWTPMISSNGKGYMSSEGEIVKYIICNFISIASIKTAGGPPQNFSVSRAGPVPPEVSGQLSFFEAHV